MANKSKMQSWKERTVGQEKVVQIDTQEGPLSPAFINPPGQRVKQKFHPVQTDSIKLNSRQQVFMQS